MNKIILICIFFLITACVTSINYDPKQSHSASEAKLIIDRFLKEQPPKFVPSEIEITDEYLKTLTNLVRREGTPMMKIVPTTTYTYYSNIGNIELYFKRDIYRILVFDKDSSVVRSKFYSSNESKAKKFIDALYTLKMTLGIQ